jgi:hypothetical protein
VSEVSVLCTISCQHAATHCGAPSLLTVTMQFASVALRPLLLA